MAQMLAMVNERQDDRDLQLPHVEFAYNNSVSVATGLAPNEVHMGRLPRLPVTVFERTGVAVHQSLARDHPAYCDLATDRQQRVNDIVRKDHAPTVSRVDRRNSALADALHPVPKFAVGGWAWVSNSDSNIRQGAKANTDAKVLKAKLAPNWTGPYKSQQLVPAPPPTSWTARRSATNSSIWIFLRPARFGCSSACTDRTLQALCQPPRQQEHPQIPVGGIDAVCAQHFFRRILYVPRHSRQRFGSPPMTRIGEDHQPQVGPGARWSHRVAVQDALGGTLRTVLGAENGTPTLSHPHFAFWGRHFGQAPPNQPPLPPDAH